MADCEPKDLSVGKLPPILLDSFLQGLDHGPEVLQGGAIGLDAAVIDFAPESGKYLLAKTDPITFATDRIGEYAVHVTANDIVCMGGIPKWFLATALLPTGTDEEGVNNIFKQLKETCASLGVSLIGGHTEITLALDRPLVIGCMLGEVNDTGLLLPKNACSGDVLILTQGIAIEGTAVLARDAATDLLEAGLTNDQVKAARDLLNHPGISVFPAAKVLWGYEGLRALHDPTEGGIMTGVQEIAGAAGLGFELETEKILVRQETTAVCRALNLDPLGLLASGALVAVMCPEEVEQALDSLADMGIPAAAIGRLVDSDSSLVNNAGLPTFERDELARYLEGSHQVD